MDNTTTNVKGCTLSDQELIEKCDKLISALCLNDRAWRMTVPPDFNNDSDMILTELVARFKKSIAPTEGLVVSEGLIDNGV